MEQREDAERSWRSAGEGEEEGEERPTLRLCLWKSHFWSTKPRGDCFGEEEAARDQQVPPPLLQPLLVRVRSCRRVGVLAPAGIGVGVAGIGVGVGCLLV